MKRNMLSSAIFMSLGIYVWNNFSVQAILSVIAVLGGYCFWCFKKERTAAMVLAAIMLIAGFVSIEFSNQVAIKKALPFTNGEIKVSGKVLDVQETGFGQSIKVKHLYKNDKGADKSIKIKAYINDTSVKIKYGDIVNFTAKLKIPDSGTGFGGYNDLMNERSNGILLESAGNAKGIYVFENKITPYNIFDLSYMIKTFVCDRISALYRPETSGLMQGILVGEKNNIPEEITENFRISGISHTIVVSGMHVNVFVAILMLVFSAIGIGKSKFAMLCYIAGAWFFVFISGCGLSAVRAACVTTILFVGRLFKRDADALNSLGGAVLIMLFINPGIYFNIGFRLSVFSAGAILVFTSVILKRFNIKNAVGEVAVVTTSAQLGILPVISQSFGYMGTFGVLTNVLVCPVISVLFGVGALSLIIGGIPFIGTAAIWFCELVLEGIIFISNTVASLPFSVIRFGSIDKNILLVYILFCTSFWLLLSEEIIYSRRVCSLAVFILCAISVGGIFSSGSYVTFLDTGDSDCTMIESEGTVIMFDGAGSYNYSVADSVILPYLANRKIRSVDAAFITHYHIDHIGGVIELIERGCVKRVIIPAGIAKSSFKIKSAAEKAGIPLHYMGNSDKLRFGDIEIKAYNTFDSKEENNGFVYIATCNGRRIFIAGDTHEEGENILLSYGENLKSDILKVPHHGSDTSGSDKFLKAVSPSVAVVCSGKDIISDKRKQLYKSIGAKLYFTHQMGHIRINLSKKGKMSILPGRNNFYELRNFKKAG